MRWFIAGLVLLALWIGYAASPYLALRDLALAVQRGDEAGVAARLNLRALRHALARHIVSELSASERVGALSTADAQLAAGALSAAADPLLETLLTARGVLDALRGAAAGPLGASREEAPFAAGGPSLSRLAAFLAASQWRGFRTVYFSLPPDAGRGQRYRLQLRLSRLSWRLVGLELPTDLRDRIAHEIVQRQKARRS